MLEKSLSEALLQCAILVQSQIGKLLPEENSRLVSAMRYSALSEGKRIRPFLLMASANIFGIKPVSSVNAAVALEFIHTYSLIHDDLPAMDDDDLRRGKATCHKQFDEATAILAGDALLTYAFEILAESATHKETAVRCELIKIIAKASGHNGMAGGQMLDLEKAGIKISKEEIAQLHRLKTGELFMAAAESGAVLGRATVEERKALRYYANDLGLAFQIKDDILDHAPTTNKESEENASIVDIIGLEDAKKYLELLRVQAIDHLKIFGDKAKLLKELAEFVVMRGK